MANTLSGKSKIWIGASVLVLAAAGVLVAGHYYTPNGKETAGTIVPAERYRSAQVSSSDVKLGDQSTAQSMQTDAYQQAATGQQDSGLAFSMECRMKQGDAYSRSAHYFRVI